MSFFSENQRFIGKRRRLDNLQAANTLKQRPREQLNTPGHPLHSTTIRLRSQLLGKRTLNPKPDP